MEDCGLDDEDLVRELLDDDSPFILLPTSSEKEPERESNVSRFIPRVFSGPTIFDIENALLVCDWKLVPERRSSSNTIPAATRTATAATTTTTTGFASALSFVKGLEKNKMENKYTLRVKCSENGTVDDGYKWRKYGQKTIKNSPNPRSYYRCTSPQCSAKKQVERSTVDPETLVVTYEGLHLHYAYPFFQFMQQTMEPAAEPTKRPRLDWVETMVGPLEDPSLITSLQHDQQPQPQANCLNSFAKGDQTSPILPAQPTPLGLLQDVVPMAVMNPLKSPCYDIMSSPSSSSPSWFTNGCYDVGILSTK